MIVNRRYPGTTPFEKEQKDIFFGREKDIESLLERVKFEPLILLYSKSGLGKSSLLNAGIEPLLEMQGNTEVLNVRFTRYSEGGVSPVNNIVGKLSEISGKRSILDRIMKDENSLWYHVKRLQLEQKEKCKYVFIFDQFEELFSYPDEDIKQFKKQLADLLYVQIPQHFRDEIHELLDLDPDFLSHEEQEKIYQPIDVRVITAIRSDKMSLLNELTDFLPNILKNYYHLEALDRERAKDAILNPAQADGEFLSDKFSYEDSLLENILDYLTEKNKKPIETFQLQIICARAEVISIRKKRGKPEIENVSVDLEELHDLKNIFTDHYNETINTIKDENQRKAARKLLEDKLIVDGNRVSLPDRLVMREAGITQELISHLVNSRIIRAEPNTVGGLSYELSHDTLVEPILSVRKIRVDKEEEERAEAERQDELRIALEKAKKERFERERERKRQKQIIIIISIAAAISIAFGIFGFYYYYEARQSLINLLKSDARGFFSNEEYLAAKGKFEQLLKYSEAPDSIQKKIDNCIYLDSLSLIFNKKIAIFDSLIQISENENNTELEYLDTANIMLKQIEELGYVPGYNKLKGSRDKYLIQANSQIKDKMDVVTRMFETAIRSDDPNLKQDGVMLFKQLEGLNPENNEIKRFKTLYKLK